MKRSALPLVCGRRAGCGGGGSQAAAGDGENGRAIGRAVVGQDPFDEHAEAPEEGDSAAQESDGADGLFVWQDFGVGQAGGVVDGDVDIVPADSGAAFAGLVGEGAVVVRAAAPDALARAALDAPQLLDVDVDQLAGSLALVAQDRFEPEPSELAHPTALQDRRDRRQRAVEQLGDLRPGEPQAPQRDDHLDSLLISPVRDPLGCRGPIAQTSLPFGAIARHPLRAGPVAHSGRLGGLRDTGPARERRATMAQTERGVSVQLHPELLGTGASTPSASKEDRMNNVPSNSNS